MQGDMFMKATGIVRRIDELGRVVIPKEIRRTLRIREGDPLEIFVDREGGVILKKYSPIGELGDFAREYADSIHQSVSHTAAICDKDSIIAVSGSGKKELIDKPVSTQVEELMQSRTRHKADSASGGQMIGVTINDDPSKYTAQMVVPILASGDSIGAVMLLSKDSGAAIGQAEAKVCETAASFMGRQMEN